ncbi:MAG: diacylglycerol/lipid kinase family protein [Methanococcaceae archaeon]
MKTKDACCKNKALFILNPKAGVLPSNFIISRDLERHKNITYVKSKSIPDTDEILKKNFDNYEVFIAAGGDGTVHSVATKLVGSEKMLGVLPMGSGNGFAREFGFSSGLRPLMDDIERGESLEMDILEINNIVCLNVAGIGLDSFVAHSFAKRKLRGFFPYAWLTLKTFIQLRPVFVTLHIGDEKVISEDLFVLTIANTRQFGNNAFIAPEALPNDGKMDLVLIRPFPKIFGPLFVIRLFTKKINMSKYVTHIQTDKEVRIKTDEKRFHIDGEPVMFPGEIIVRLKREALKVLRTSRNRL